MTGRPETKKRREREAAAASRRPVKPELKREALQLAEQHGAAEAARQTGIPRGTISMWKTRAAKAAAKTQPQVAAPAAEQADSAPPDTRAQKLRARAEKAREAQFRAEDRADKQIGKGQSAESRNSMVSANGFAGTASALAEDARLEELHEVALSEAQARLVLDLVGAVFEDVALPRPEGLLRARLQSWPAVPDPAAVEAAREDVRRVIRAEVRAEFVAELEAARQAQRALPAAEDEEEPDDGVADAEVVEDTEPSEEPEDAEVVEEESESRRTAPFAVDGYLLSKPAQLTQPSRYSGFSHPETW